MIQTMSTKENRKFIKDAIQEALNNLKIPGVKVVAHPNVTYSNSSFKMKIEAAIVDSSGQAQTTEAKHWSLYCNRWGFKKDDLGKRFLFDGRWLVTLTGCRLSRHKYPLSITRVDNGRLYKCAPENLTKV